PAPPALGGALPRGAGACGCAPTRPALRQHSGRRSGRARGVLTGPAADEREPAAAPHSVGSRGRRSARRCADARRLDGAADANLAGMNSNWVAVVSRLYGSIGGAPADGLSSDAASACAAAPPDATGAGAAVIAAARRWIGVPYVWGGNHGRGAAAMLAGAPDPA